MKYERSSYNKSQYLSLGHSRALKTIYVRLLTEAASEMLAFYIFAFYIQSQQMYQICCFKTSEDLIKDLNRMHL